MSSSRCRLCGAALTRTFVDLGMSPPCQRFLTLEQLDDMEPFYPLNVRICEACLLVQLPAYVPPEDIFTDYAYFSSYSDSWVRHCRTFVETAVERLGLDETALVVEAASNDGYLLQHVAERGFRCLGIEPACNVAEVAVAKGIPTEVCFLGEETGSKLRATHGPANLVVANNVFGHVPDIVDFSKGLRALVADEGTVTIEIPHLLRLIEGREYDTIYHEHYQYVTLLTTQRVLARAGLAVVDVEELRSHGGSLRTWSRPAERAGRPSQEVDRVLALEAAAGLHIVEGHSGFADAVAAVRNDFVAFLVDCSRRGRTVAGYGAPGKGNTLLNHCGVRADLLPFLVDRNTVKHGMYTPGTHIPIHPVEYLYEAKPEYIVILPWNLRDEISGQLESAREWGGKFVVALPHLEVF